MIFDNIDFEGFEQSLTEDEKRYCKEFSKKERPNDLGKQQTVRAKLLSTLKPIRAELMSSLRVLQTTYQGKAREWETEGQRLLTEEKRAYSEFAGAFSRTIHELTDRTSILWQKHSQEEEKGLVKKAAEAIGSAASDKQEKTGETLQLKLSSLEGEKVRHKMQAEAMVEDFTDAWDELLQQYQVRCEEAANYLALELEDEQQ